MSWVAVGVGAATLVGGYMQGQSNTRAANRAADAQVQSAQLGVDEQRRQFDQIQELLRPYAQGGEEANFRQRAMLGLVNSDWEKYEREQLERSQQYQGLARAGEDAILQNASATGGLRGGNTQAALAQFRPELLNNMFQQRFNNLGSLSSMGQNAAAMTGNAGMNSANQITSLFNQQGAARAGAQLARGQAQSNMWGNMAQTGGMLAGAYFGGAF